MRTLTPLEFGDLEHQIEAILMPHGYQLTKRQHMEAFGSRITDFQRGSQSISLVWDARDNAISLWYRKDDQSEPTSLAQLSLARKFRSDIELLLKGFRNRMPESLKHAI